MSDFPGGPVVKEPPADAEDVYVFNLISGSFAFSKSILNIWKLLVHILLKPS